MFHFIDINLLIAIQGFKTVLDLICTNWYHDFENIHMYSHVIKNQTKVYEYSLIYFAIKLSLE